MPEKQHPLLKRRGRISFPRREIAENPEKVMLALSRILIVEADLRYEFDQVEYYGFSEDFEEVEPHCTAPNYVAKFELHEVETPEGEEQKYRVDFVGFEKSKNRGVNTGSEEPA